MDDRTARTLNAINRSFYSARAAEFSATRNAPWPGWERLAAQLPPGELDVLDVGCGNGRFAAFLAARVPRVRYLGVDACEPLLAAARRRGIPWADFQALDFVAGPPGALLPAGPFSLIALFGVIHHVPGEARRRALLRAAAERLAPGGMLALAFWRFQAFPRFRARALPLADWNAGGRPPLDPAGLESGDALLAWGPDGDVRYCHFADERETSRLLDALPLRCVDRYDADGREGALNHYAILRAAPA